MLRIPRLFPDGDSDELVRPGLSRENISEAITTLIGLGLVAASAHDGVHPFAPYYRDVELTPAGEQLRRELAPWCVVRWWEKHWRWAIATIIALGGAAAVWFRR